MNIRRSVFWSVPVLVISTVILVWFVKPFSSLDETKAPADTNITAEAQIQGKETTKVGISHANSNDHLQPTATAVSATTRKDKGQQMLEILSAQNDVPITFYGKLEDQFDQAITNATVRFSIQIDNGYTNGTEKGQTVSDVEGLFAISGYHGERLSVVPEKPGYALASSNGGGVYSRLYPEEQRIHPDSYKPVVIKMWKLQGEEPLLTVTQDYKLQYTDAPIHFDLIAGKIVPSGGDVRIVIHRPDGEVSLRNQRDWTLKIEAVDGELRESGGEECFTYWAPETGYQPATTFIFSTNAPHKWFDGFSQGLYVKSRNGLVYSKLGFSFRLNQKPNGFMYVRFGGVANTNGSRNWEAAPNTYKPR